MDLEPQVFVLRTTTLTTTIQISHSTDHVQCSKTILFLSLYSMVFQWKSISRLDDRNLHFLALSLFSSLLDHTLQTPENCFFIIALNFDFENGNLILKGRVSSSVSLFKKNYNMFFYPFACKLKEVSSIASSSIPSSASVSLHKFIF